MSVLSETPVEHKDLGKIIRPSRIKLSGFFAKMVPKTDDIALAPIKPYDQRFPEKATKKALTAMRNYRSI